MNMILKKQKGFVSIIVVITLSMILSILTISFVLVMSRSQRQTLDLQLSTQANYAAETGINDAIRAILYNPTAIPLDDTSCDPTPTVAGMTVSSAKTNAVIGTGTNGTAKAEYTCQLISSGVKDVRIDINDQSSRIYPIKTDPQSAKSIDIEWEDKTVNNDFNTGAVDAYPSISGWGPNHPAMLKITVYNPCNTNCADFDRAAFNAQKTFFVKPAPNGGGNINYANDSDGAAVFGSCAAISDSRPYACKVSIQNLFYAPGQQIDTTKNNALFIKITPIYGSSAVRFMAVNNSGSGNSAQAIYGAQYRIDVTGKSNDVYRRLEVRVPLSTYTNPPTGIESADICKKFEWNGTSKINNACP